MVDYVRLAATANRLITKNGRTITLQRDNRTPTNAAQPWKGNTTNDGGGTLAVPAAVVPPNTVRQFGLTALGQGTEFNDVIKASEQIAIAFVGNTDVRVYDSILDGGLIWKIIGLQSLRPANTQVLVFIGMRR